MLLLWASMSFPWCHLQLGSKSPLSVHCSPDQNHTWPQRPWAGPLGLVLQAASLSTASDLVPWGGTCIRGEITRLENLNCISWGREACLEMEWQKSCYFVSSKDFVCKLWSDFYTINVWQCCLVPFFFFFSIKQLHHDKYGGNEGEGEKIIICIQKWELRQ